MKKNFSFKNISSISVVLFFSLVFVPICFFLAVKNTHFDLFDSHYYLCNFSIFRYYLKNSFELKTIFNFLHIHHPPFTHIVSFFITELFGFDFYFIGNIVFFSACFVITALTFRKLFLNITILQTVILFFFFLNPIFLSLALMYNLELAVMLFVCIYYYVVVAKKKYMWAGIIIGIGCLTKTVFIFFVLGDLLKRLYLSIKNRNYCFLRQLFIAIIICSFWYVFRLQTVSSELMSNCVKEVSSVPGLTFSTGVIFIDNLIYYPVSIINFLSLPITILFFAFLVILIAKKKDIFIYWIVIPLILYVLIGLRGVENFFYLFPLYPAIFLVILYPISIIKSKLLKVVFVFLLLGLQLVHSYKLYQQHPQVQLRFKTSFLMPSLRKDIQAGYISGVHSDGLFSFDFLNIFLTYSPSQIDMTQSCDKFLIYIADAADLKNKEDRLDYLYLFVDNEKHDNSSDEIFKIVKEDFIILEKHIEDRFAFFYCKRRKN